MTTPSRVTSDGVSPETARALRAATQRPFTGKPQRTDGRLTKENLWREAQVRLYAPNSPTDPAQPCPSLVGRNRATALPLVLAKPRPPRRCARGSGTLGSMRSSVTAVRYPASVATQPRGT